MKFDALAVIGCSVAERKPIAVRCANGRQCEAYADRKRYAFATVVVIVNYYYLTLYTIRIRLIYDYAEKSISRFH